MEGKRLPLLHEVDQAGAESSLSSDSVLVCRDIVKRFPGHIALDHVHFEVRKGEVHALLGQNGAGKSTLVKIITGVYSYDEGTITVDGKPARIQHPKHAEELGIAIIHQDQQHVLQFDVTRNAFLGDELKGPSGLLDFKRMRQLTEEALRRIDADFTADTPVGELSVGQREQVAIVSALLKNPKILILDEPTASLSNREVRKLFEIIRTLQSQGVTIIYISHHFEEIFEISNRITVLRDGKRAGTLTTSETNKEEIIRLMIGRDLTQLYPKENLPCGEVVLEVQNLSQGRSVHDVSFSARRGEILGIAGLVGAGRTELALTIYGALKPTSGRILVHGKPFSPRTPADAAASGIAFIPEDRRQEGLIANLTVKENMTIANISRWSRWGLVRRAREKQTVRDMIEKLSIATTGVNQLIQNLSGGNQQKVVIGRWLTGSSDIYIFDEPTTGVDVGSKVEIYHQMTELARKGAAVLLISSDFEELLGMSDRILVMRKGRITKQFEAGEATQQELLYWSTGGEGPQEEGTR
jgi:ribose transport system ATP-binding protein